MGGRRAMMNDRDVDALARGELTWVVLGEPADTKLSPKRLAAFERAKRDGFLVNHGRDTMLQHIYWLWCKARSTPYVLVEKRGRYARVELSLEPAGWPLSQRAKHLLAAIGYSSRDDWQGPHCSVRSRVPVGREADIAREMLRIAVECRPTAMQS
jgi:hypothetical protein